MRNGCWWVRQRAAATRHAFLEGAERGAPADPGGHVPRLHRAAVRRDARLLRPVADHRALDRACWRTTSATPSPASTRASSASTRARRSERLDDFLSAVRTIYASTMSEKALHYRAAARAPGQGRADGAAGAAGVRRHATATLFYPQIAGVGLSFNPYVWNEQIDPAAGMLRLVFGLGTRAVDRCDDDYTRVVALNAPERRPESDQRRGAAIRAAAGRRARPRGQPARLARCPARWLGSSPDLPLEMFASRDRGLEQQMREAGRDSVFSRVAHLRSSAHGHAASSPTCGGCSHSCRRPTLPGRRRVHRQFLIVRYTIGSTCVQCRPLQVKGGRRLSRLPRDPGGRHRPRRRRAR